MLRIFYFLLPYWIISYYLWTTLPTRPVAILWFGTLYLLSCLFIATRGKRILYVLTRDPWIVLLIIWSGLSCFWSVNLSITFASFRSLIVQYVLVGYLVTTYSIQGIIGIFSRILSLAGILSFLYLTFLPGQALVIGQHGGVSWGGIFPHQSVLAATMALAVVSLLYSFLMEKSRIKSRLSRIFIMLVTCLCLYLLFFCNSKTSPVSLFVSFSILPFFFIERIKGMKARNLSFVFLVYIFLIGIPLLYFSQEFLIAEVLNKDPSLSGRAYLWEYLTERSLERPFGYGLEAFWRNQALSDAAAAATGYSFGNSHSSYYDILIGLGFPGVALLSICIAAVIRRTVILAFYHSRLEFQWALQILVLILIASYSDSFIGFLKPRTIGWFIFCIIALTSSLEIAKYQKPSVHRAQTYSEIKALLQAK